MGIGMINLIPGYPSDSYGFKFYLALKSKPGSMIGGPEIGTVWDIDMLGFEIEFPTYRTDNGLTGYQFELSATAVPEPSSLAAVLCGIGGLTSFAFRKRK